MFVSLDGPGPMFQRVYEALRAEILEGRLVSGARLPSSRALARESGVSRTTVLLAYDQLLAEGYVEGRAGSGTYVSHSLPDLAPSRVRGGDAGGSEPAPPRLSAYG